jgi:hypothetical protein
MTSKSFTALKEQLALTTNLERYTSAQRDKNTLAKSKIIFI